MMHQTAELDAKIDNALAAWGVHLAAEQRRQCWVFIELLLKWNQKFNLTSIRDVEGVVVKHFLDSWSLLPYLDDAKNLLDVGTGGGFPGVPLAILNKERNFTLLDSVEKKINFLKHAKIECGLENINPVHCRIESYLASDTFDVIMCRAFASITDIVDKVKHCLSPNGRLLLMKGAVPTEEINAYGGDVQIENITVPYLDAERHLIIVKGVAGDANNSNHKSKRRGG